MDAIDCRKPDSGPYVVVYPYARGGGPKRMANGRQRHGNPARANHRQSSAPQTLPNPAQAIAQESQVRSQGIRQLGRRVRLIGKYVAVFFFVSVRRYPCYP